ncbi:hypothetical protein ACIBO6_25215 [Streptomyces luteogriseus]|uniref:hypothetical protein n=1 Tax=Streptomyces luteogriseus TaxID=68233 RepID=UPI0037A8EB31
MTVVADEGTLLLTDRQCFAVLNWAAEQPQNGPVLRAFLASIALAALRPTEALALRVRDVELDDDGTGVLLVPAQGQDVSVERADGTGAVRRVPACLELVALLRAEISRRRLRDDDAIFALDDGRPLTALVYRKVWRQARTAVLEAHEINSPRGRTVSALRDACLAAWLKNGDQSAAHILRVAECAGVSAPRLAERFAHCLRRPTRAEIPWDGLEAALPLPGLGDELATAELCP